MLLLFPRLLASHCPLTAPAVGLGVQYAHSIHHLRCDRGIFARLEHTKSGSDYMRRHVYKELSSPQTRRGSWTNLQSQNNWGME